jgi:hypothetical protein
MFKRLLSAALLVTAFTVLGNAKPLNYLQAVPSGSHDNKFHQGGTVIMDAKTVYRAPASSNTTITTAYRYVDVSCYSDVISGALPFMDTTTVSNGQLVTLYCSSAATFTIYDNDTLSNSCAELSEGTSITVPASHAAELTFVFYNGSWYQCGPLVGVNSAYSFPGNVSIGGTLSLAGSNIAATNTVVGSHTVTTDQYIMGDQIVDGTALVKGVLSAGTGPVALTNAGGSILPASLAAGSLPATVIVSSLAPNAVYPAAVSAGTYSNITLPAANVAAGDLGGGVIATAVAKLSLNSFVVCADSGTLTVSSATVVLCTKAGAMEIDLPDAATSDGKVFIFKKTDADASIVSLDSNGGTVDGADPYVAIDAQYDTVTIISDGTNWHVISEDLN